MTLARVGGGTFQREPEYKPILQDYAEPTRERVMQNRALMATLAIAASASIMVPIAYPKMPKPISGVLLLSSVLNFAALSALLGASTKGEAFYAMTQAAQKESFKQRLEGAVRLDLAEREIQKDLAGLDLIERQPEVLQPGFLNKFGLGWMKQAPQPMKAAIDVSPQIQTVTASSSNHPAAYQSVQYEEPEPFAPSEHWIATISQSMAEPDPEKRRFQHLKISGGSQSGKSTLFSKLLEMLIHQLAAVGSSAAINLIDPKYPKTKWAIAPSFVGFEQVRAGINAAILELDNRKTACIKAARSDVDQPTFSRYIVVIDEWDSIWGNGKGYGSVIDKDTAENIRNDVLRLLKESAAYDMTAVVIGQSPLSSATGFTRSDLNSACHLVLGVEALKWAQDPGFPFKGQSADLQEYLSALIDADYRCALIVPNMSSPFVEAIPRLTITSLQAQTVQAEEEDFWESPVDGDPLLALKGWYQSQDPRPSDVQLAAEFKRLIGRDCNDRGIEYLKSLLEK